MYIIECYKYIDIFMITLLHTYMYMSVHLPACVYVPKILPPYNIAKLPKSASFTFRGSNLLCPYVLICSSFPVVDHRGHQEYSTFSLYQGGWMFYNAVQCTCIYLKFILLTWFVSVTFKA